MSALGTTLGMLACSVLAGVFLVQTVRAERLWFAAIAGRAPIKPRVFWRLYAYTMLCVVFTAAAIALGAQ